MKKLIFLNLTFFVIISSCIDEPEDTDGFSCNGTTCMYVSNNATYSDVSDCYNNCGSTGGGGYNCNGSTCTHVSTGGQYGDLTACQNACSNPGNNTYDCNGTTCVLVTNGQYGTLAACQNNCGGGTAPTHTFPSTQFAGTQCQTMNNSGAWWTQEFTVGSNTSFALRFTASYAADAAVVTPDQLSAFQNNQSFNGYGLFDNQIGTSFFTLPPGPYHLAMRSQSNSENTLSIELDYNITLPASDDCTFYDNYLSAAEVMIAGAVFWQGFSTQSGYRYFIDGCSSGIDVYVIPVSELSSFQGGQSFNYYSDYYESGCGASPGLWEIELPPADYYLVGRNGTSASQSITYRMERWRQN